MEIVFIEHTEIDKKKWDSCIKKSFNGIVYAFSWYLDIVAENWSALVSGDYDVIMPLTAKKRYGINYLVQPVYSQQLGVFSTHKLSNDIVSKFLLNIPSKFRYIDIKLNIYNHTDIDGFNYTSNINYELDLISAYDEIKEKYSENTRRNIIKAKNNIISVIEGVTANELIGLFKSEVGDPRNKFTNSEYSKLRQIIAHSLRYSSCEIYGAYTRQNTLCAATLFIISNGRAINLVSVSNDDGKELKAMFMIMDEFIKRNTGKNLILDFEGSNIEGVGRFFKGFGSTKCEYLSVRKNNLPFLLRLFKK